jgi:hypothetical protein
MTFVCNDAGAALASGEQQLNQKAPTMAAGGAGSRIPLGLWHKGRGAIWVASGLCVTVKRASGGGCVWTLLATQLQPKSPAEEFVHLCRAARPGFT